MLPRLAGQLETDCLIVGHVVYPLPSDPTTDPKTVGRPIDTFHQLKLLHIQFLPAKCVQCDCVGSTMCEADQI